MGVTAWLLVSLVVYQKSLHGKISVTFTSWAIMAPGMYEDPAIFKPLSQIWLSRSTYKVTSYIDFVPYVWSFRKFEAYLVNFTNDLNSRNIMKGFKKAHTTGLTWERSKLQVYPNHYHCLEACWCRLLKQYKKIQDEVKYLSHKYYTVCEHFFNATDHMDNHPSKHVDPNPQSSKFTNCWRSRRRACSSCKMRQYFDLSSDEIEYLSKLKVALWRVNRKLHHSITKLIPGLPQKGSRSCLTIGKWNKI